MSSPIEDYGPIGEGGTAALDSKTGAVDLLCWPRFDGDACFAAWLRERDFRWSLGDDVFESYYAEAEAPARRRRG